MVGDRTDCQFPTVKVLTAYAKGCRCDACVRSHHAYFVNYRVAHPDVVKRNKAATLERARARRRALYDYDRRIGPKQPRRQSDGRYWRVYFPGHPMAHRNGGAFVHRINAYETWRAAGSPPLRCHQCHVELADWTEVAVDHLDQNRDNNHPDNLGIACRPCNNRFYPTAQFHSRTTVVVIKRWLADGAEPTAIASRFNVAPSVIHRIASGRTYREVS